MSSGLLRLVSRGPARAFAILPLPLKVLAKKFPAGGAVDGICNDGSPGADAAKKDLCGESSNGYVKERVIRGQVARSEQWLVTPAHATV